MEIEQKFEILFTSFWGKLQKSRLSTIDAFIYHLLLKFTVDKKSTSFNIELTDIKKYTKLSNEQIVASLTSLSNKDFLNYKRVNSGLFYITICDG